MILEHEPIAITGMGLVSAYGEGVEAYRDGMADGRLPHLADRGERGRIRVGEAEVSEDSSTSSRWFARAIDEALGAVDSMGSTALITVGQATTGRGFSRGQQREVFAPESPSLAATSRIVISHACGSALFGVAVASRLLRSGNVDRVIVAGANTANDYLAASLETVGAISGTAPRPFDAERDGIFIGEGAGALMLERARDARADGREQLAEIVGFAAHVGGSSAAASDVDVVRGTISNASRLIPVASYVYVHAHATGTPQGDAVELSAIETVAEERQMAEIAVASHKGALGHLLHASAFPSVVSAIGALREFRLDTTLGTTTPLHGKSGSVLPHGPSLRVPRIDYAVVNALGFGGNNASIVLQ